ncbi:MAG: EAL domain-containing protein [Phycisphaeraceae bacterium]|nr:MAG: EAL domain-containing protein [Phycisphaeraceae bacterium]
MAESGVGKPDRGRLEALIRDRNVVSYFQPIVHLATGAVAGMESLTRPGEGSGFAGVAELFDEAERLGMLWELERVTRARTVETAGRLLPPHAQLFLNNTPRVVADPRFAGELLRAVRDATGLTPNRVVVEVTERSESQYTEGLAEQVALLKSYGFEVAIDDVGAGTSGLNRIMALRPRWLKLDRELVESIHADRVKQNLVKFFLHFARLSGVRLVAEGLERREEIEELIELGVPYAQGFYLGRPAPTVEPPSHELTSWLRSRHGEAEHGRAADPAKIRVARYARDVSTVESGTPVGAALGAMTRGGATDGVVVVESDRIVGWCERRALERAAGEGRAGAPVDLCVTSGTGVVEPGATVLESLEIASARGESSINLPLIVGDGPMLIGVVYVTDLLRAAALVAREFQTRISPLTGLPGRVKADEHLASLIKNARAVGEAHDAAVIDIRGLADYNARFGYELGDQLLRGLADLSRSALARNDPRVFLAHLGDDLFLAVAPAGVLRQRLGRLAVRFDRSVGRFESAVSSSPDGFDAAGDEDRAGPRAPGVTPTLRVVFLADVLARITRPGDVIHLAAAARDGRRGVVRRTHGGSTVTVLDPDTRPPDAMRAA